MRRVKDMRNVGILTAAVVAVIAVSTIKVHADSLVIKFKGGHTQVIKLKEPLENIIKIELVERTVYGKIQKEDKENINPSNGENINKSKNTKRTRSESVINFGNGIKGEWVTPNPYLPPANE